MATKKANKTKTEKKRRSIILMAWRAFRYSLWAASEASGVVGVITWRALADQWAILTYCEEEEAPRQPAPRHRTRVVQHPRGLIKITRHPRPVTQERRSTPPPLPRRQAARQATADAIRRACVRATTVRKAAPGCSVVSVLSSNIII